MGPQICPYDPSSDGGVSMSQMLGDTAASLNSCDSDLAKRFENAALTLGK